MPLSKDILGLALYNKAQQWNDTDISEEDIDQARKDFWEGMAEEFINHIINNMELIVPGIGLLDGEGRPVTGSSTTGSAQ